MNELQQMTLNEAPTPKEAPKDSGARIHIMNRALDALEDFSESPGKSQQLARMEAENIRESIIKYYVKKTKHYEKVGPPKALKECAGNDKKAAKALEALQAFENSTETKVLQLAGTKGLILFKKIK